MKKMIFLRLFVVLNILALLSSCKKEIGNLNAPDLEDYSNPSIAQLNSLVTGAEAGMRNNNAMYLDVVGMIGREMYRFAGSEPRYAQELLGQGTGDQAKVLDRAGFYLNNPWAARYRVVKNCNTLIAAAGNSSFASAAEKKGYTGFAKTIKAHQLLMNLNFTYTNGIRIQVENEDNLGPIVGYNDALAAIATLLDEAKTDLTGATISFTLSPGFAGFADAAGLIKFNRALAARIAVYRQQWPAALTALNESFFDLSGDFNTGVKNVFGTSTGDQLNDAFFPQNSAGDIRLAHPAYATDIAPGDDRIGKATLRNSPVTSSGLTSNRDVWVYQSAQAPVPIIRNEELILIYAEAKIQSAATPDAIIALNRIRTGHGLGVYAGSPAPAALINEMLAQRRYSLFFEGHRWVDMRRYNKLAELPIDRAGDDVWEKMPLPLTEE